MGWTDGAVVSKSFDFLVRGVFDERLTSLHSYAYKSLA